MDENLERSSKFLEDFDKPIRTKEQLLNVNYTDEEYKRMQMCGMLFDRSSLTNKNLINEFFTKQPCIYNQTIYKYAGRIFHCLKADANDNLLFKSLKNADLDEDPSQYAQVTTQVPKIDYKDSSERKNTLNLAFSVLKCKSIGVFFQAVNC
jgi:hypothetical protein